MRFQKNLSKVFITFRRCKMLKISKTIWSQSMFYLSRHTKTISRVVSLDKDILVSLICWYLILLDSQSIYLQEMKPQTVNARSYKQHLQVYLGDILIMIGNKLKPRQTVPCLCCLDEEGGGISFVRLRGRSAKKGCRPIVDLAVR